MEIPIKTRVFSLILKGIVVLSAAVGVFLSAYASRNTFMGGSWVLCTLRFSPISSSQSSR